MFRLSRALLVRIVLLSCCVIPLAQHISHEALAQEKIRIGISFLSPSFLPTIVAEKKGFYGKYGLASEHVLISLSVAMSALGTGDLDLRLLCSSRSIRRNKRHPPQAGDDHTEKPGFCVGC